MQTHPIIRPHAILFLLLLPLLIALTPTYAHEHWVMAEPATTGTVNVTVCSGHYFPRSTFALADKVLQCVTVTSSGGRVTELTTAMEKTCRVGGYTPAEPGPHRVDFVLRRTRAKQPSYEGRTFVLRNGGSPSPSLLSSGRGLELVPRGEVGQLRPGSDLSVEVLLDGVAQAGTITHLPEGGKESFFRTGKGEPAHVPVKRSGWHLLFARVNGRGVSLAIYVPSKTGEK